MNAIEKAALLNYAITLLVKRSQLDDNERISIAEFHEEWKSSKTYGSNEYIQYGTTANGRAQLYVSVRNVPANSPNPTVAVSPANWKKL